MTTPQPTLTIGEAARYLSVSIDTLRRWDRDGRLRAERLTPTSPRRYRREDLDKMRAAS